MLIFQDTFLRLPGLKQYFLWYSEIDGEELKVIKGRKIIFMVRKEY